MPVKYKNNILIIILVLFTISFITASRIPFVELFFYLDFFMVLYILVSVIFKRGAVVTRKTANLLKIFLLILLPSIFLLAFSENVTASLGFLGQYLFSVVIINVFLDNVNSNEHLKKLLMMMFFALVVNSFLFMYVYLVAGANLYFPEWGGRFSLGEFTPNEMGHYMVFLLFLINMFVGPGKNIVLEAVTMIPYVLTLSKTVWVQLSIYLLLKRTVSLAVLLVVFHVYMFVTDDFVLYTYLDRFISELSFDTTSNSIRVDMARSSLGNLENTIFFPAYHSVDNIRQEFENAVSAHNGVLSYLTNFGLISFLFLTISFFLFVYMKSSDKRARSIFIFLFIDLVSLLFNPLINSRIVWFPIFLYIFIINNNVFYHEAKKRKVCVYD